MTRKKDLENQLDKLYENKSKGAQIRSRDKWIDEGEKNSSYFLRLENKHQSKNTINKINNAGSNFIKTKDILDQLCNFYENLYSSNDVPINDIDTYLDNINVSSVLSEKEKEMCENFPTLIK